MKTITSQRPFRDDLTAVAGLGANKAFLLLDQDAVYTVKCGQVDLFAVMTSNSGEILNRWPPLSASRMEWLSSVRGACRCPR